MMTYVSKIPRIPAEAEYFCRRKILMVNGMHTTLAFITLCKLEKGGLQGDAWKDHTLITPATATEDEVSQRGREGPELTRRRLVRRGDGGRVGEARGAQGLRSESIAQVSNNTAERMNDRC